MTRSSEATQGTDREQFNRNSRNSSRPPSSDGPKVPPKPRRRAKSGRKRGAQPGHQGARRKLAPIKQVKEDYVKFDMCRRCGQGHSACCVVQDIDYNRRKRRRKMKWRRFVHVGISLGLPMGLIVLLLAVQNAFSAMGPVSGDFGPFYASSFLWKSQAHSLETERGFSSLPLNRAAAASASDEWQPYPLYGGEMTSIAMGPVISQGTGYIETVYVGTRDAGVFKTRDGGASWQPVRTGLTFYPIRSLQVDPQNPNTLYAGTDFDGIWKSR